MKRSWIVAALLALHWLIAVGSVRGKSTTFDEIAHLTAGYSYWLTGDFRLEPENVQLPRWPALPLLLGHYRFPSLDQAAWWKSDAYAVGYHFFYDQGNDARAMLLAGRAMMALLTIPVGLLVYAVARRLLGPAGALLSLVLYTFCPTMLATGALITADTSATLFLNVFVWALWIMLQRVTPVTVLGSALAMAGLFLTIKTAAVAVLMALALVAIRLVAGGPLEVALRRPTIVASRTRQLAVFTAAGLVHAALVVLLLWAGYSFRYSAFRAAEPGRDDLGWESVAPVPAPLELARAHRVLPEAYLYGLSYTLHHSKSRRAFLNGEYDWHGWRRFFPYCLAVKTPLSLFVLLVLAAAAGATAWRSARPSPRWLYESAPLWVLLAVYWAVAVSSNLNVGHRHLSPTYPSMLILAGGAAHWLANRRRAMAALVVGAVLAFVAESVASWPHYLAYFNQLAGGPRHAYRHLVDSSLDWGQDLPGLERWLDAHGLAGQYRTPVYLSYFGTGNPEYHGIAATRLPSYFDHWRRREWYQLTGGVYCISATMLQSVYSSVPGPWAAPYEQAYQNALAELRTIAQAAEPERARLSGEFVREKLTMFEQLRFARLCAYLRRREPDDQVGYSILIYRLTDRDVSDALSGPPVELEPEVRVAGME